MNDDLLLLDTHCWLWAQLGLVDQLSRGALSAIRRAESAGRLRVSVVSIWELGMLAQHGRVSLPLDVRTWVREAFTKPGLALAPLTPEIALESSESPRRVARRSRGPYPRGYSTDPAGYPAH